MPPLAWLAVCVAAAVGAYLVGWPAWRAYRSREARDVNAERYLAWRGRASSSRPRTTREGMTGEERRRILVASALGILALIGLALFFAGS